jgi:DNA primase
MEDNLQQMRQAGNDADLEKYFTIHEQLKGAEKDIASILGIVISK